MALIVLAEETKEILVEVLTHLKLSNPATGSVRTIMIDKDFAEIAAIGELWPEVHMEMCLFHVLKAMKRKLSSYSYTSEKKDVVKRILQSMAYATSTER